MPMNTGPVTSGSLVVVKKKNAKKGDEPTEPKEHKTPKEAKEPKAPKEKREKKAKDDAPRATSIVPFMPPEAENIVTLNGEMSGTNVLSINEEEAAEHHQAMLDLQAKYESTYFEMARHLYEISLKRLYRAASCGGFGTFEEYVESLGMHIRKAKQLITLWWWYGIEQRADPRLLNGAHEIGWTKAAELVRVVSPENADEWFDVARRHNVGDLGIRAKIAREKHGIVKDRRTGAQVKVPPRTNVVVTQTASDHPTIIPSVSSDGAGTTTEASPANVIDATAAPVSGTDDVVQDRMPAPSIPVVLDVPVVGAPPPSDTEVQEVIGSAEKWRKVVFNVPEKSMDTVNEARLMARKLWDSDHDGHCFVMMCQHFLTFAHDKVPVMIAEWLEKLERDSGLKIIAIDPRQDKIIYGRHHIDPNPTSDVAGINERREEAGDGRQQESGSRGDEQREVDSDAVDSGTGETSQD